jgi:hypothetical protein
MANFNFDASAVAPQQTYAPLPVGTYLAHITESDVVKLKSGNGDGLKLTFEILDGPYKSRRIWQQLSVKHNIEKTQSIAQGQLSALCRAVNVIKLVDTGALHNKPVKINVILREATDGYQAANEVKGYEPAGGPAPVVSAPAAETPAARPAAPAWARK